MTQDKDEQREMQLDAILDALVSICQGDKRIQVTEHYTYVVDQNGYRHIDCKTTNYRLVNDR